MDGHRDSQRDTIIPCHNCVAGYKKDRQNNIKDCQDHREKNFSDIEE